MSINSFFLGDSDSSLSNYAQAIDQTTSLLIGAIKEKASIYSGKKSKDYDDLLAYLSISEQPESLDKCLDNIIPQLVEHSLWVNSPKSMAHLHCPVTLASLAAEQCISLLNQSMDSWDQSPLATYIEQHLIDQLKARLFTKPTAADGVFTSGGTQSNLVGLLMARDAFCQQVLHHNVSKQGLPEASSKFRILCSEHTHFSVHKALHLLGLGERAIVWVSTDEKGCLCPQSLLHEVQTLKGNGLYPFAIVATAGGTDFGQFDPLNAIYDIAKRFNIWLHVDAAVGGCLLFSKHYTHLIDGIGEADSVTVDFHKLFFQPISCGAFFCKKAEDFKHLTYHADYLNPEDSMLDSLNLVDKSIQTTRRFDALKLSLTLKHVGADNFAKWVDHIIDTTKQLSELILKQTCLQLASRSGVNLSGDFNTLVFRFYDGKLCEHELNKLNQHIHEAVYYSGDYAIALTSFADSRYLKITLVNPMVTVSIVLSCINFIISLGADYMKNAINSPHETNAYEAV